MPPTASTPGYSYAVVNTAFEITTSAVPPASDAVGAVYVSVWSSARSNASASESPERDFVATAPGAALSDTVQLDGKLDTAPSRKFAAKADDETERRHARTDATTAKRPHPRWRALVFMFDFPDRDSRSAAGKGRGWGGVYPARARASSAFSRAIRARVFRAKGAKSGVSASGGRGAGESAGRRRGRRRGRGGGGRPNSRTAEAPGP